MNPQQKKAIQQGEMQFASVAQAWRCIQQGRISFEDVSKVPPRGISQARWSAMLNNRREVE